jgi:hypothetical protein
MEYTNEINTLSLCPCWWRQAGQRRGNIVTPANWDDLRQAVRAEARRRGLSVADLAEALGRGPSALRVQLALRDPPSAALQGALRGWLNGGGPPVAAGASQAAGGASQARHGHGLRPGAEPEPPTPAPAPPSGDPSPRSRMCAPSAKFAAAPGIVSPQITGWEYRVVRLPDHDWAGQIGALGAHGMVGWELVSVSGGVAYMKRGCGGDDGG